MKKLISIFTVLLIATPAMADLYNVASTNYVQGAFNALDSAKQDTLTTAQQNAVDSGITAGKVSTYDGYATTIAGKQDTIDSTHKLSADLVDDSTSTNKFVTASDKTTWNGKQDLIDSTHKLSADLVQDGTTNKVVTAAEKTAWSGKQDAITVSNGAASTDGQYVNGVALSNGTMTVSKSYLTVPVKSGGNYAATGAAIWFE